MVAYSAGMSNATDVASSEQKGVSSSAPNTTASQAVETSAAPNHGRIPSALTTDQTLSTGQNADVRARGKDNQRENENSKNVNVENELDRPELARPPTTANRQITMSSLYTIAGEDPPTPKPHLPIPPQTLIDIKFLYLKEYAPGLDHFLETNWYSSGPAIEHLLRHSKLLEMFASMVELFAGTKSDDYDMMRKLPATEARMVWSLMEVLPRELVAPSLSSTAATAASPVSAAGNIPAAANDPELKRILNRLTVFQHLMTGAPLYENPLADLPPAHPTGYRQREFFFWKCLGQFVSLHTVAQHRFSQQTQQAQHSEAPSVSTSNVTSTAQPQQQTSQSQIDPQLQSQSLPQQHSPQQQQQQLASDMAAASLQAAIPFMQMRQFLDQQENRDVLYSIASVRHLSAKARLLGLQERLQTSARMAGSSTSGEMSGFGAPVGGGARAGEGLDQAQQQGQQYNTNTNTNTDHSNGNANTTTTGSPFPPPTETDESLLDSADTHKLRVSRRFLEDEMAGRGMDQVVQRVCAMAVRCWGYGNAG
ncbi:MAG: hypothetical protein M1831_003012 [Alyxoria varia]|nr:MAG: hypothetical protein M1831_003012 [Alyxoria varia]